VSRKFPVETSSGFWRAGPAGLVVLFALATPWSIAAAQTALVLGGVLLLAGVLTGRIQPPPLPTPFYFLLLFVALQALSIPLGVHPGRSLGCFQGSWVALFPLILWGLLADARTRSRALASLGVSGALAGAYGVFQHFTGLHPLGNRALQSYGGGGFIAVGTLGNHLTYAGVLLPIFFLTLGLLLDGSGRRLWAGCFALVGLGVLFSFARTAWIGAAAGLLVFGLFRGRKVLLLACGGLILSLVAIALAEEAFRNRLLSILLIGDDPRMRLWGTALRIIHDHLWFGAGLGSFKTLFPVYRLPGVYMATGNPHNDLLNLTVETGVLGAAAWLSMWAAFFMATRPAHRSSPEAVERGATAGRPVRPDRAVEGFDGVGAGPTGRRLWLPDALRAAVAALLIGGLGQVFSGDEEVAQAWWLVATAALLHARTYAGDPPSMTSRLRGMGRRLMQALRRAG
jgi:O-antigen ligase